MQRYIGSCIHTIGRILQCIDRIFKVMHTLKECPFIAQFMSRKYINDLQKKFRRQAWVKKKLNIGGTIEEKIRVYRQNFSLLTQLTEGHNILGSFQNIECVFMVDIHIRKAVRTFLSFASWHKTFSSTVQSDQALKFDNEKIKLFLTIEGTGRND